MTFEHSNSFFTVYKSLFNHQSDSCFVLNADGSVLLVNDAALHITEYSRKELLKSFAAPLLHKHCMQRALMGFKRALKGQTAVFSVFFQQKSGAEIELSVTLLPYYFNGMIKGVAGIAKDVTRQKKLEKLINGQSNILEMMAAGASFTEVLDHIVYFIEEITNESIGSIMLANPAGTHLYAGSAPHLPAEYLNAIHQLPIGPDTGSCGTAAFSKSEVMTPDIAADIRWRDFADIALRHQLKACWSSPIFDHEQQLIGTFALYYRMQRLPTQLDRHIIEQATHLTSLIVQHYRAKEKIQFMSYHDELTGLPNRKLFDKRLGYALNKNTLSDPQISVLHINLDRFKLINDSLGHHKGDFVLKQAAQRLQHCLGSADMPSRQNGDEFTIFLHNRSKADTNRLSHKIVELLSQPYRIDEQEIVITPSVGVSLYPLDGCTADELLRKAILAMHQAKKEGGNTVRFYHVLQEKQSYQRLELESELRKALEKNEFQLLYQPIIDLSTQTTASAEALIRWVHPIFGSVPPSRFIPIAEETGMIVAIGEWILKTACGQIKQWETSGLNLHVAVNLSVRQFYQPDFPAVIEKILAETGADPNRLTLEITESMTMNVEKATAVLRSFKKLGVKISLDDFGTGYSSMSYLKTFPIDYLKIDRSFIREIDQSKRDEGIAAAILFMSQSLGLRVIAEGVETAAQLQVLRQHGCDQVQGFLFSKPISAREIRAFQQFFQLTEK